MSYSTGPGGYQQGGGGAPTAAQVLAALVGQAITALKITLTQASGSDAVVLTEGARLRLGAGANEFLQGVAGVVINTPGQFSADSGLASRSASALLSIGNAGTSNFGVDNSGNVSLVGVGSGVRLAIGATAPTIVAGIGAALVANNGTAAFTFNLGAAAQTGTITFPSATTGWVVYMQNVTTPASFVLGQTGFTQTTATFTSYGRVGGLATNWNANDVMACIAIGF